VTFDLDSEVVAGFGFTWRQFLRLPMWQICVAPEQDQMVNILRLVPILTMVRDHYQKHLRITSGLRPDLYNKAIGGASKSYHIVGKAVDFMVDGVSSNDVRLWLAPQLDKLGIRMEDASTPHVHIDMGIVTGGRYFVP